MSDDLLLLAHHRLRDVTWPRFLRAPDAQLLEQLYVPALSRAVRYDRVCAYFSSHILATAARGFGGLIANLLALGDAAPRPSVRLIINEQLDPDDLDALLATGDTRNLEKQLLSGIKTPTDALAKNRLQMLAWLVKAGLLEVRVGVMRRTYGLLHAKYGIVVDPQGDVLTFMGSDNETTAALVENYEELHLVPGWRDSEFTDYYRNSFETLWAGKDEHVDMVPLPDAVRLRLIRFAPSTPPEELQHSPEMVEAAMVWHFLAAAAYLPNGAAAMDATAPVSMWPHQQRVVEDTASSFPAGRLLCDEVGMGKTIEAILTLRRLLAGRGVGRALLLVPAGLQKQWQDELREKGGLLVPRWDGGIVYWPDGRTDKQEIVDALAQHNLLLLSREWARLAANRAVVLTAPSWDLVLLDEAHAARRATQEEREFNSNNLLLDLLRQLQLRQHTRGIVLLSATPMQTQPWEPWDLLAVLGVGGAWQVDFTDIRTYYQAIDALHGEGLDIPTAQAVARLLVQTPDIQPPPGATALQNVEVLTHQLAFATTERRELADWLRASAPLALRMHRNTRNTLRQYFRQGLLQAPPSRRNVQDVRFDYETQQERDTYRAIETYIDRRYEQMEKEKPGKGFVMTIYRRRASSSPLALRQSLARRRTDLENVIQKHHYNEWFDAQDEELDTRDLGDADVDEKIDKGLPKEAAIAQAEHHEINKLLERLESLSATDSKLARFWQGLNEVTADGRAVLVFTEYTDTMEYLRDNLRLSYGSSLGCYSGGGGQVWDGTQWNSVSKADITARLGNGQLRVLICTDAASEGLNLQAASALINYDLPWNPSKVEQRIGRIDRIGQRQPVMPIRNLFLIDSVDDQVYSALRMRCGLFEHFVGPMQPVLALARDKFRTNLRREEMPNFLKELERKANDVKGDAATSSAYSESQAVKFEPEKSPVTREDIEKALALLAKGSGKVKARKRGDGTWKLTGMPSLKQPVTTAQSTLERVKDAVPLTLFDESLGEVARLLPLPSLAPLVVGEVVEGVYRACEVRWVDKNGTQPITSLEHLRQLLKEWDGALSSAAEIVAAKTEARITAMKRLKAMKARHEEIATDAIAAQLAAARSRLMRELARNLRCVGSDDLQKLFQKQLQGTSASSQRFKSAFKLLGGPPRWTSLEDHEALRYADELTEGQRQQRINLASELDAALNDPRWLAQKSKT